MSQIEKAVNMFRQVKNSLEDKLLQAGLTGAQTYYVLVNLADDYSLGEAICVVLDADGAVPLLMGGGSEIGWAIYPLRRNRQVAIWWYPDEEGYWLGSQVLFGKPGEFARYEEGKWVLIKEPWKEVQEE